MKTIIARDLKKGFSHPAPLEILDEVSLEAHSGQAIAIMGPSGVGKSTLLHILGTLESPDMGTLEIMGKNATKGGAHKFRNSHIGFVFQGYFLLEEATTLENVLLPGKIAGNVDPKRAMALLAEVGLEHRANFCAKTLSGGEKQRAAIARALYNDPEIILADEPTGNLDEETSRGIDTLLLDCAWKRGKTVIVVTHNPELAYACDTVFSLKNKRLEPKE
jgi:ABC-type lipoprotein export system ATPase subunit